LGIIFTVFAGHTAKRALLKHAEGKKGFTSCASAFSHVIAIVAL